MEGAISAIAEFDSQGFSQVDPKVRLAEEKERQKKMKEREKLSKKPSRKITKADIDKMEEMAAKDAPEVEFDSNAALRKIELYYAKLGHKIKYKPKRKPTAKTSPEELQDILFNIERDLSIGQGVDICVTGYSTGMSGLETLHRIYNPLGLQLKGLGKATEEAKPLWEDLMVEFAIKHEDWFAMGVEKRILFFTAQLVMSVDAANRVATVMDSATVPAEVVEAAEDL